MAAKDKVIRHEAYFKIVGACLVLIGGAVVKAMLS